MRELLKHICIGVLLHGSKRRSNSFDLKALQDIRGTSPSGVHGCFLLGFCRCFSCHTWHVPTCRTPPGEGGAARRKGGVSPTQRASVVSDFYAGKIMGILLRRARAAPSARGGRRVGRGARELIVREGVAGRNGPHGWEAENVGQDRRLQRGKGAASFPQRLTLHRASSPLPTPPHEKSETSAGRFRISLEIKVAG
jgi:hypothetical protein